MPINSYGDQVIEPSIPLESEQPATSSEFLPPSPPPIPPLMLRGPQGPSLPPTAPPTQLISPEQASQQEMMRRAQYAYAADPTAQTEQAVSAALRFQGIRQYQRDLASGMTAAEALAKSAPLLFGGPKQGNLGQAASFIKATRPPSVQYRDIGGVLYEIAPGKRPVPISERPGMTPYQTEQIRLKGQQLTEAEKALLGADVTELKGIEKQLGGTEEHGFGVLHPFGGNKAQMDALRKRAYELRQKIQAEYGRKRASTESPRESSIPTVTSKEQFDRLPSGAIYISKNGKRHRKP